ncbi:fibroblast growth factor 19-like [Astyanax mexicanus]|uniref:fibroblast growth factor 19-like n=1 Tax=Astyanax mexicanus TaxID=7994 RepID=UPI0020CB2A46|nr:fibroblast growth factor 19-like [Astyanax mexicanus]
MFEFAVVSLLLHLPLSLSLPIYDSSPLLAFDDQVRQIHLYTESKHRSLFLAIYPNGTVTEAPTQTEHTLLELKAIKPGETVILGVMSLLYLCVDSSGQLTGLEPTLQTNTADCSFTELLLPDGYTYFISAHYRLPVTLLSYSHFLKLRNTLPIDTKAAADEQQNPDWFKGEVDLDSDDPFGLRQAVQYPRSPFFHMDR